MLTKSLITFVKYILLFSLLLNTSYAAQKFAPIMVDDIITFVPYSEVTVSLGGDKTITKDQDIILKATINLPSEVVSYVWSEGSVVKGTASTFSTATLSVGTHTITLTVTDSNGLTISDTIVITIDDARDELNHANGTEIVGTTKGEFSVGQGSANYSLSIDVPPGVAGMEPKLSLNYNSNAGNSYMGVGWSMGGVSAVTRCPQTEATDGTGHKFGVKYNSDDRFCLDGQRLILVSGTYGASGSEYRTQIDTYAKVMARGDYNGGPRYFDVYTKSGLRYIYGHSNNSYEHTGSGTVLKLWKVDRIIDTYDNTISHYYTANTSTGEHYLNKVSYADNTVEYDYEDRTDKASGYHEGVVASVKKRLKSVTVNTAGTEVRTYNISYGNETQGSKRSKVTSITEHVPNGDLETLHFSWKYSDQYVLDEKDMSLPTSEVVVHNTNIANYSERMKQDKGVQFVDINGDGLKDLVQLYQDGNRATKRQVCLNNGSTISNCSNSYTNTLPDAYFSDSNGQSMGTRLADINGDGLLDIIQLYDADNSYYHNVAQRHIWINTGSGFTPYYYDSTLPAMYFSDGDGKDMGTRLADINGDGFVDIIQLYNAPTPLRRVYLGSATGFSYSYAISTHLPGAFFSDSDGEDMGTRLADLDGDGLVDIIQIYNPDVHYGGVVQSSVWLNYGSGFGASNYTMPNTFFSDGDGKDMGTRLADINGDGLLDLVQLFKSTDHYGNKTQKKVYLNTGKTFVFNTPYTNTLPYGAYIAGDDGESRGTRFADINGDGLLDIVQLYLPSNGVGQRRAYFNKGGSFNFNYDYSQRLPDTYFADSDGKDMGTQLNDVNGDGLPDIIQVFSSDKYYAGIEQRRVYINQNNPMLVTDIYNHKDQDIKIAYKDMVDSSIYHNYSTHGKRNTYGFNKISNGNIELTIAQHLVYSVKSDSGVGIDNTLRYMYYGYVFNKLRGSQGFHAITTYDDTARMLSTEYYKQIGIKNGVNDTDGFQFTGMPYLSYSNRLYGTSQYLHKTYIYYKDASTRTSIYEPYTYINKQNTYDTDGTTHLKSDYHHNDLSADGLGNIIQTVDRTLDKLTNIDSRKTTINAYTVENLSAWHIGRLTKATVTHATGSSPTIDKSSTFAYNNKGLLSKEVANAGTALALIKEYSYDSHGNKASERISGSGVTTNTTTFKYDSLGKFQTSVTNALGLSETKTYDARFGTLASLTGSNGLRTTWQYDELGRKVKETRADGTVSLWGHTWTSSNDIGASYAIYSTSMSSDGKPFSRTYHDSLGRDVGGYTYGLRSSGTRRIQSTKTYNAKGELTREELPHYSGDTSGRIMTYYDGYGRVYYVSKTGSNNTDQVYRTEYDKFTQTTTNPKGVSKVTKKNALNQTIQIIDASGTSVASSINYTYDSTGNLKTTTDAGGNVIRMNYDDIGNKTYMNDPDLGVWYYSYNALGKVKSQWSGTQGYTKSKHASYKSYDILARVTKEMTYNRQEYNANAATYSYNQTKYVYGSNGSSVGSRGKLVKATATSRIKGEATKIQTIYTGYDNKGRISTSTTNISSRGNYTSKLAYDSHGRVQTKTYPNGYRVHNHYKRGILDSITGSDGKVHYAISNLSAFGQTTSATFANGVHTATGVDSAGYVSGITSVPSYGAKVQELAYTYDGLGSVLTRKDKSVTGKYINETFTYDKMDRLYSLRTASNVVGSYIKNKDYRYNRLGNITYQSGIGSYSYHTNKPHAVKTAGTRNYTYDTTGNMISRNQQSITYNPLNKPHAMDSGKVKFYYGAGGQRYLKTARYTNTFYLGKSYEEEVTNSQNKQICYITLGSKTIGTHTQVLNTNYVTSHPNHRELPFNQYFHTDALGSVTAITNDSGTVIERRSYDPLGKIRAMHYGTNNNTLANTVIQSTRAYTGHEQIKEIHGLIHMNARVYDSNIGRFLSADTVIQDPHDSQAYNRYSYVRNNPLKYTDPSGNSWWTDFRDKIRNNIRTIAAVVVGVVIAVYAPQLLVKYLSMGKGAISTVMVTGALAGAASGAILTRSFSGAMKGAVFGAISAGVANIIGHGNNVFAQIARTGKTAKAILHGLSRAAISKLQNGTGKGSFLGGFAASLLGANIAENFSNAHTIVKVTMAAIAGGTASALGGGKFSNGAMSGAFIMLFNDLANTYPSKEKMLNIAQSKWIMGDKGMYKTLMVNGTDTGKISAFSRYGPSTGDKFFSNLGNGVVNGVHFVGDHGDGIGLALSVGAMATPGGWGYAMGVAAIGIDIGQGDAYGVSIGAGAMFIKSPVAGAVDIGYGISQLF